MTRSVWACADCGWEWPLGTPPPASAECDACGCGDLERVPSHMVAAIDAMEAAKAHEAGPV